MLKKYNFTDDDCLLKEKFSYCLTNRTTFFTLKYGHLIIIHTA